MQLLHVGEQASQTLVDLLGKNPSPQPEGSTHLKNVGKVKVPWGHG